MMRRAILISAPFSALLLALPAHALTVDSAGSAQTGTSASVSAHGAVDAQLDGNAAADRLRAVARDAANRGMRTAHSSVHAAVGVGHSTYTSVSRLPRAVTANGAASTTLQIEGVVTATRPPATHATADDGHRFASASLDSAAPQGSVSATVAHGGNATRTSRGTVSVQANTSTDAASRASATVDSARHAVTSTLRPNVSVSAGGAASFQW